MMDLIASSDRLCSHLSYSISLVQFPSTWNLQFLNEHCGKSILILSPPKYSFICYAGWICTNEASVRQTPLARGAGVKLTPLCLRGLATSHLPHIRLTFHINAARNIKFVNRLNPNELNKLFALPPVIEELDVIKVHWTGNLFA